MAFAEEGWVGVVAEEELDPEGGAWRAGQYSRDSCDTVGQPGPSEHREILVPVWADIGVARIIGSHAVIAQIDPEQHVGENGIAQQSVALTGIGRQRDTVPAIESN